MRQVKFRGIDVITGNWAYGYYYPSRGNAIIRDDNDRECIVAPETVGEYSGLKDRNGKEIYESDVIKSEKNTWVIENKFGCFLMRFISGDLKPSNGFILSYDFNIDYYEIIGNIHSNPELLKP